MAAPATRIVHGNIPADVALLDEPNMLITALVTTPARTKTVYKGVNRAVCGVEFTDPMLDFAFDGHVSTRAGLSTGHPGTAVTELANFAGARFGFDPSVGTLVYEDPVSTQNVNDPEIIKFKIVHYPFVNG